MVRCVHDPRHHTCVGAVQAQFGSGQPMTVIHVTNAGEKPLTDSQKPEALADMAELLVRLDRPHKHRRKYRLTWMGNAQDGRV